MAEKKTYDRTRTERSQRLGDEIKAAGGAAFPVRFRTAEELQKLQDLIEWGYGANRNDVLRRLVEEKHTALMKRAGKAR